MKRIEARFVAAFVATGIGLVTITQTTGCNAATEVNSIFMCLDGEGNRPRDTFYPDTTTIFCDVDWVGRNPDTTVNAFIHQHKGEGAAVGSGSLQPVDIEWAVGEAVGGEQKSIISFAWTIQGPAGPVPFPVGNYTCDVYVNGESAGNSKFDITYPGCAKTDPSNCPPSTPPQDCPLGGAATNGAICLGIYRDQTQCPSVTAATSYTACTCNQNGNGLWACSQ